eukprot:8074157-Heterocapsa_arctica.AAC.1
MSRIASRPTAVERIRTQRPGNTYIGYCGSSQLAATRKYIYRASREHTVRRIAQRHQSSDVKVKSPWHGNNVLTVVAVAHPA